MYEKWNGKKGRLKAAVISEQAVLLKQFFDIEVFFCYDRYGKLGGFTLFAPDRKEEMKEIDEVNNKIRTPIGYNIIEIKDVKRFIRMMNNMIRMYLIWCYERRIDPCFYNIIPLGNKNGIESMDRCRTDLWKLVIAEKMKETAGKEKIENLSDGE